MPVEYAGFTLRPNGFFAGNPAMDVPGGRNGESIDNRHQAGSGGAACCSGPR